MDIVKRNFFRLLRSGAFDSNELIEPMSVFKWQKLYQFSVMHDVVAIAYKGIENCKLQFFLHMTDKQWQEWQKAAEEDRAKSHELSDEEDEFLRSDHLTNPVLNHKLQNILDDENSNTTTRQLLLSIVSVVRHILNEGLPIRQILMLGIYIQSQSKDIDFTTLRKWLESLRLMPMARLACEILIQYFGFHAEDLPFVDGKPDKNIERIAQELLDFTNTRSRDWYFSQDEDGIFVHNSNTSAMFSHVRRSARYFHYYPSEGLTNFFASFVHSLSHIEE